MRNFGKKWFISASSGILGKILLVAFGLGVGFVVILFAFLSPYFLSMILE